MVAKRNSGIEILRLICMLMIVTLHVLGAGGVLAATEPLSKDYQAAWLWETACYGAVDCFGIISGYVMCGKQFHFKKWISFWLEVWSITFIVYIGTRLLQFHQLNLIEMAINSMPFKTPLWYVRAYLGMMLFIPVINAFLAKQRKNARVYLVILLTVFSVIPTVYRIDLFITSAGYSVIWLIVLYLIGGLIRLEKIDETFNAIVYFLLYVCFTVAAWLSKILVETNSYHKTGEYAEWNVLIAYTSPLILMAAICLFLCMVKIKIELPKIFYLLSSSAFGVYVIHMHYIINGRYVSLRWHTWAEVPGVKMYLGLALGVLKIFACSLFVSVVATWIARRFIKLLFLSRPAKIISKYLEMDSYSDGN